MPNMTCELRGARAGDGADVVGRTDSRLPSGARDPASRRLVPPATRSNPKQWKPMVMYLLLGSLSLQAGMHLAGCKDDSSSAASNQTVNSVAFMRIADAHGENFSVSAEKTRLALAQMEQLMASTAGKPKLDPRIRRFAGLQVEYELAFSRHVPTEREAYQDPTKIPRDLWEMQRRYHQEALDLCKTYAPEWRAGLADRITQDTELLEKLK